MPTVMELARQRQQMAQLPKQGGRGILGGQGINLAQPYQPGMQYANPGFTSPTGRGQLPGLPGFRDIPGVTGRTYNEDMARRQQPWTQPTTPPWAQGMPQMRLPQLPPLEGQMPGGRQGFNIQQLLQTMFGGGQGLLTQGQRQTDPGGWYDPNTGLYQPPMPQAPPGMAIPQVMPPAQFVGRNLPANHPFFQRMSPRIRTEPPQQAQPPVNIGGGGTLTGPSGRQQATPIQPGGMQYANPGFASPTGRTPFKQFSPFGGGGILGGINLLSPQPRFNYGQPTNPRMVNPASRVNTNAYARRDFLK